MAPNDPYRLAFIPCVICSQDLFVWPVEHSGCVGTSLLRSDYKRHCSFCRGHSYSLLDYSLWEEPCCEQPCRENHMERDWCLLAIVTWVELEADLAAPVKFPKAATPADSMITTAWEILSQKSCTQILNPHKMQPVILLAKWVYSGTAKNCNLGHAIYGKSQADLENTREDLFFL